MHCQSIMAESIWIKIRVGLIDLDESRNPSVMKVHEVGHVTGFMVFFIVSLVLVRVLLVTKNIINHECTGMMRFLSIWLRACLALTPPDTDLIFGLKKALRAFMETENMIRFKVYKASMLHPTDIKRNDSFLVDSSWILVMYDYLKV